MTTQDINTAALVSAPYSGTPEHYLVVEEQFGPDIDALMCALRRASAVCKMVTGSFGDEADSFNDEILSNACCALDGLLDQAMIITAGKSA